MGEARENFPLFPLGLVLLPGEVVPLHIFEQRYRTMIAECLEHDREFGIVWLSEDGLRTVGCAAAVTRVLERMDDGRLNILAQGTHPFRLVRRVDALPYPAGAVELLDDDEPVHEPEAGAAVLAAARERYSELVARVTDDVPPVEELEQLDAYAMAAAVELELEAKQELLELRSEAERLERVAELFGATMQRLDYAERAGELARSNGRVRH